MSSCHSTKRRASRNIYVLTDKCNSRCTERNECIVKDYEGLLVRVAVCAILIAIVSVYWSSVTSSGDDKLTGKLNIESAKRRKLGNLICIRCERIN